MSGSLGRRRPPERVPTSAGQEGLSELRCFCVGLEVYVCRVALVVEGQGVSPRDDVPVPGREVSTVLYVTDKMNHLTGPVERTFQVATLSPDSPFDRVIVFRIIRKPQLSALPLCSNRSGELLRIDSEICFLTG
jgi:hypothetical protein